MLKDEIFEFVRVRLRFSQNQTQFISDRIHLSADAYVQFGLLTNYLQARERSLHIHHHLFAIVLLHLFFASHHLRYFGVGHALYHHDTALLFEPSDLLYCRTEWSHHVCLLAIHTLIGVYLSLSAWENSCEFGLRDSAYRTSESSFDMI